MKSIVFLMLMLIASPIQAKILLNQKECQGLVDEFAVNFIKDQRFSGFYPFAEAGLSDPEGPILNQTGKDFFGRVTKSLGEEMKQYCKNGAGKIDIHAFTQQMHKACSVHCIKHEGISKAPQKASLTCSIGVCGEITNGLDNVGRGIDMAEAHVAK